MATNIRVKRICEYCGEEFVAKTTVTRYCSQKCSQRAYKARARSGKLEASNRETQIVREKPIEVIKAKDFLSISDTCVLLGVSRRTIYRLIKRNELNTGKIGKRTIIRRSDIDKLFQQPAPMQPISPAAKEEKPFARSEYYSLPEIEQKYGLSDRTVYELIKRNGIEKVKRGKFVFASREKIDRLF